MSGYKYLKRGEYVIGEVTETGGKKKLSNIRAPMEGGKLMCEVELEDGLGRLGRLGSAPEDGEVDREVSLGSGPGAGEVVRQVRLESAPDGEVVREVRVESAGVARGSGRGPNRIGRRVSA